MRRLLVLLFAAMVVLVGCGDDDDTEATGADTAVEDDATSAEEGDGAESEAEEEDEDFSGSGSGDFCDSARRFDEEFEDAFTNATDPGEMERVFQAVGDALDTLEDEAPGEIEDDVKILASAFRQFIDALEEVDYDFTKLPPEQQEAISTPEVEAASERVERYGEEVCGIESSSSTDTSSG